MSADDQKFILDGTLEVLYDVVAPQQQSERGDTAVHTAPSRVTVFGLPARDEADEVASHLLRQLFDPARCRFEVLSAETLFGEAVARIKEEEPGILLIGTLPVKRMTRTRYLCKRYRAQFPEMKIVVGYWGTEMSPERVRERFQAAGADLVATTLEDTRTQLLALIPIQNNGAPSKPLVSVT